MWHRISKYPQHLPLAMIVFVLISCTGSIKVRNISTVYTPSDWPQAGGGPTREFNATEEIVPPLYLAWRKGVSTPPGKFLTAIQGKVFSTTMGGKLVVLESGTGVEIGSIDIGKSVEGGVALDGSMAYFGRVDSKWSLYAYELRNGDFIWKKNIGGVQSPPLVAGGLLYATSLNGRLYCLDMETGNVKWTYKNGAPSRSSPARWKGNVIAANDSGYVFGVSGVSGEEKWRYQTGASVFASPVISNGTVYVGNIDGKFVALDYSDGSLRWVHETEGKIYSTAASADDYIYFGTNGGRVYSLSSDDGKIRWVAEINSPVNTGLLVSGDYLYFGALDHHIYCLEKGSGEVIWKWKLDGRISTVPIEHKGMLFIGSEDKYIYAFTPDSLESEKK